MVRFPKTKCKLVVTAFYLSGHQHLAAVQRGKTTIFQQAAGVMLSELSGFLFTSGIVLAASTFVAAGKPENESIDEGDSNVALETFNKSYKNLVSNSTRNKDDKIILAPSFGGSYVALESALAKAGISVTTSAKDQHATIDLQKLMKGSPSFAAERKIQAALVEEGLLMLPGEAFGSEKPGQFRITAPSLSAEDISTLVDKLYKVASVFHVTLAKRPVAVISAEDTPKNSDKNVSKVDNDDESVASNVPESSRKKRRS